MKSSRSSLNTINPEVILKLKVELLENGEYLATSSDFPELLAQGRTMSEAVEIAQDVGRKLIESYQEHGDRLPKKIQSQLSHPMKPSHLEVPVAVV